ncbi:MAG: MFS transporter [Lentisphaeria bacterium]|nr:MFS transporter [Lentisphaeria bacterium]
MSGNAIPINTTAEEMPPDQCNAEKPPRITYFIASAWTINCLAYSIIYPFIPLYLHQDRGIPMTKVGTIFPLMGIATIAAPPLWGYLTDRFGRRPIMQLGQIGRAAVFGSLALAAYLQAPFEIFAGLLMLSAAVGAAFQVAANSYLVDITSPENREISVGRISVGCNVGWAFGPMLGSFLSSIPFYYLFGITATLCTVCWGVCWVFCPEPERKNSEKKEKLPFSVMLKNTILMELIAYVFLLSLLTSQLFSTMSVFATSDVGILRKTLGVIYSVNGFTIILCQQPMTMLLNQLKVMTSRRLLLGTVLFAIGFAIMGFCSNAWHMACSVLILTLGELTVFPALFAAMAKIAPPGKLGMTMASRSLAEGMGTAVGPWLGALAYAQWRGMPPLLWSILVIPAILSGIGFLRMGKHINQQDNNQR